MSLTDPLSDRMEKVLETKSEHLSPVQIFIKEWVDAATSTKSGAKWREFVHSWKLHVGKYMDLKNPKSDWTYKVVEGHSLMHNFDRIYVPRSLRRRVLTWYHHYLCHPTVETDLHKLLLRFVFGKVFGPKLVRCAKSAINVKNSRNEVQGTDISCTQRGRNLRTLAHCMC